MTGGAPTLDLLQVGVAVGLIAVSFAALALASLRAVSVWRALGGGSVVLGSMAVAALLRWFVVPHEIVTVFIGYRATQQAIDLFPVGHYGAGATTFHHLLLKVLPHDHASIMWAHAVIGVLALPLAATFAARFLEDRRAGLVTAVLVAATPIFVRNDTSDANNVPLLWWLFGGLVLWDQYLENRSRIALAGATVLFALAGVSRPEALLIVLSAALLVVWARRRRIPLEDGAFLVACAAGVLLVLPHVLHIVGATVGLQSRGSLSGLSPERILSIPLLLVHENALLQPLYYPPLLALAALAALVMERPASRPRVALAVLILISLVPYVVDLCWANMARVHTPAAMWTTFLAAAGLVAAPKWVASRSWRTVGAVALAASFLPSAYEHFRHTNERTEEDFIREALATLPRGEPFLLVRQGSEDGPIDESYTGYTHRHFPDYLLRQDGLSGGAMSVRRWFDRPVWSTPAYFFAGMRCYARYRGSGRPPAPGENLQPPCARMREQFDLQPVLEREVENLGNLRLEYYGDAPTLQVGLYRIQPKAREVPAPQAGAGD